MSDGEISSPYPLSQSNHWGPNDDKRKEKPKGVLKFKYLRNKKNKSFNFPVEDLIGFERYEDTQRYIDSTRLETTVPTDGSESESESILKQSTSLNVDSMKNMRCYVTESQGFDKKIQWVNVTHVDLICPLNNPVICPICFEEDLVAPRCNSCGHVYCYSCILRYLYSNCIQNSKCPICSKPIAIDTIKPVFFQIIEIPTIGLRVSFVLIKHNKISRTVSGHNFLNNYFKSSKCDPYLHFSLASRSSYRKLQAHLYKDYISLVESYNSNQDKFVLQAIESIDSSVLDSKVVDEHEIDRNVNEFKKLVRAVNLQRDIDSNNYRRSKGKASHYDDYYYYYQAIDGGFCLINPNIFRLIMIDRGSPEDMPPILPDMLITGIEELRVDENTRNKYKVFNVFRMGTKINLVDVEVDSWVSRVTLEKYRPSQSNAAQIHDGSEPE